MKNNLLAMTFLALCSCLVSFNLDAKRIKKAVVKREICARDCGCTNDKGVCTCAATKGACMCDMNCMCMQVKGQCLCSAKKDDCACGTSCACA